MANQYIDSSLLDKAIVFAVKAHANTERRSKGFPYIVHPLEALSIVATMTSDQEMLAAAVLHDTVEDTDTTIEQIEEAFGRRVAHLVSEESDNCVEGYDKTAPWRVRKQACIDRLMKADRDSKIVTLGDKLSNMRAIAADYRQIGDRLWERFHAPGGIVDHEWRYRALANAFADLAEFDAYHEFVAKVNEVFGEPHYTAEKIDLSDYELSGESYASLSYNHKNGKRMMKLYTSCMTKETCEAELKMTEKVQALGINVPQAYRLVTDGERVGVEYERINPKISFSSAIAQEPSKLKHYAESFADMSKELHAKRCDPNKFTSAVEHFKGVVARTKYLDEEGRQKAHHFLDQIPESPYCLHGDMHIGNVITDGRKNWWIDLGDFRYGIPLFDLGQFYFLSHCNPDELTQGMFHLDNKTMQEVWRVFVKRYYATDDVETVDRKVAPYTALYMLYWGERGEIPPHMRAFIEKWLLS